MPIFRLEINGLIPAHAGKTFSTNALMHYTGAHPRACGENGLHLEERPLEAGSSPRMRGKPSLFRGDKSQQGLIPAHAGKTLWWTRSNDHRQAHPRACGENSRLAHCPRPATGSSPRMRGKLRRSVEKLPDVGLIPAHAGKTPSHVKTVEATEAHPRACGENLFAGAGGLTEGGSSPRMRGKQTGVGALDEYLRLIPAHAGKTRSGRESYEAPRAHPRACGEN